ncbi:SH3 domain-containing protein C23A1.17-like [Amphibalanus amphitrite]|uniref:SH3 domain-containing protein C23A1.17-like n=1 Tax=Amphibalanus amphitrite TaxID=1232801 RepID=UPI001C915EEA|nr:SH3 domain-containing protein C23A1.17-like [Amphibalanus amphitrite]
MRPSAVHGPFAGRTWLVTSVPLPPSRVNVLAGLRSFEARMATLVPEQRERRGRRRRPAPPPRVSSLRRMRGTQSEADLREARSRPDSPASAYSEDQARCSTIASIDRILSSMHSLLDGGARRSASARTCRPPAPLPPPAAEDEVQYDVPRWPQPVPVHVRGPSAPAALPSRPVAGRRSPPEEVVYDTPRPRQKRVRSPSARSRRSPSPSQGTPPVPAHGGASESPRPAVPRRLDSTARLLEAQQNCHDSYLDNPPTPPPRDAPPVATSSRGVSPSPNTTLDTTQDTIDSSSSLSPAPPISAVLETLTREAVNNGPTSPAVQIPKRPGPAPAGVVTPAEGKEDGQLPVSVSERAEKLRQQLAIRQPAADGAVHCSPGGSAREEGRRHGDHCAVM